MTIKQQVLAHLEQNRDRHISGEALASLLEVSRTAVWKAIQSLREEGYTVSSVTNRGYRLLPANDILSPQGIAPYLNCPQGIENIHVFPTLESTNEKAKQLALDGAPHGSVIVAEVQSKGRGRRGKPFYSHPHGGIYMSLLLRLPNISVEQQALVTTAAAICVCRAVQTVSGLSLSIKWVNDLFFRQKKVCGILTEAVTDFESGSIPWIIIGIGINFEIRARDFPEELRDIAGSLYPDGTPPISRNRLTAEIINQVADIETLLQDGNFIQEYRERSILLGKPIEIIDGAGSYRAKAIEIDDRGYLVIELEDKSRKTLVAGEVQIIP